MDYLIWIIEETAINLPDGSYTSAFLASGTNFNGWRGYFGCVDDKDFAFINKEHKGGKAFRLAIAEYNRLLTELEERINSNV